MTSELAVPMRRECVQPDAEYAARARALREMWETVKACLSTVVGLVLILAALVAARWAFGLGG